jgi:competence protein ComEC
VGYLRLNLQRSEGFIYKFQKTPVLIILFNFIFGIISLDYPALLIVLIVQVIILKPKLFLLSLFCFLFGHLFASYHYNNIQAEINDDRSVQTYSVTVIEPPEKGSFGSRITIDIEDLSVNVIINYIGDEYFYYGDRIEVQGKLEKFKINDENEGYINFLKSKNIHLELNQPKIELISRNENLFSVIGNFKNRITEKIERGLNSPKSSLVNGVLLGKKDNLSKELEENLKITGTSHIISASGFNVIVIYILIMSLQGYIGIKRTRLLAIFFIIFYILLIGIYNLPAQRAAIMLIYLLIADQIGRQRNVLIALLLSITLILLQYPFYWKNISMLLSIFATIGLFGFGSKIKKLLFKSIPEVFKEIIASTLAATLLTLPITIHYFGTVPTLSLLSNLLILPLIPILMYVSIFIVPITFISINLAKPIFILMDWISYFILKVIEKVASFEEFYLEVNLSKIIITLLLIMTLILIDYLDWKKNEK